MLWLNKLALFSKILAIFCFFSLKTLQNMEFNTSNNSYKPIKSHWLGNASESVCRKWNMDVKFVKRWVLLMLAIFLNFSPLSPLSLIHYCQTQLKLPTNCKTLKFTQQNQQGFLELASRNLLAQNIQMGSQPTYIPPASLPPSTSLGT